ncbi:MAG: signal peptidase II [candidate division KSB1 bacterium]|nr:signal peptidase II [candidate division KSB1 bacterium]MDZ7273407.1 signal peptidase II [candidate division KSB1 bacterium]MDZ7287000.1 signal peptidase II [candidate division KSB1 bacterium]MDZ7299647.1 signal peptidase II [candidate division KSB1 bacterium]MDZ7309304.1 signal peptidase II [candidate division KSB1 bacterium]
MPQYLRRNLLVALLAAASCVGCDQLTKRLAKSILRESGPQSYLADFLRFHYTENPGVAFSLGSNWPDEVRLVLFIIAPAVCLLLLLLYMLRAHSRGAAHLLALGLVLGGGMGNLLDRVLHQGRVIDFLNLGIGTFRTAVFNLADTAISLGMLMLLITSFLPEPQGVAAAPERHGE